jgi:hypothetical protein
LCLGIGSLNVCATKWSGISLMHLPVTRKTLNQMNWSPELTASTTVFYTTVISIYDNVLFDE